MKKKQLLNQKNKNLKNNLISEYKIKNMTQKIEIVIDLDEELENCSLKNDFECDNSFINLIGELRKDNIIYYHNQPIISLDTFKYHAKIRRNQYDEDDDPQKTNSFDYWWLYITNDEKYKNITKLSDDSPVLYHAKPLVFDGTELINGHFCFYIYRNTSI